MDERRAEESKRENGGVDHERIEENTAKEGSGDK